MDENVCANCCRDISHEMSHEMSHVRNPMVAIRRYLCTLCAYVDAENEVMTFREIIKKIKTKTVVVKELAKAHCKEDPGTCGVYLVPGSSKEIKLVEVSDSVSSLGKVLPFRFAPQDVTMPYSVTIVLLGLNDWKALKAGTIKLPRGWGLSAKLKRVWPERKSRKSAAKRKP